MPRPDNPHTQPVRVVPRQFVSSVLVLKRSDVAGRPGWTGIRATRVPLSCPQAKPALPQWRLRHSFGEPVSGHYARPPVVSNSAATASARQMNTGALNAAD